MNDRIAGEVEGDPGETVHESLVDVLPSLTSSHIETDVVQPVAALVELPRESMCMEEFSRGVDIQAILDAIIPQYACAPTAGQRQPGRGHLAYLAHRGRLLPCLVHDHGHDLLGYSLDSPAEARCAEPAV